MAQYIKSTNFAVKDGLPSGDPLKIVSGTEINDEFNAIQVAVNSKADTNSPTFSGVPLAPTAAAGTNTTQIATTAFVTASQKILQVVEGVKASNTTTTSGTFIDISLSASITPSSASNKILIFSVVNGVATNNGESAGFQIQLLNNSTQLTSKQLEVQRNGTSSNGWENYLDGSFMYLDSPATTSAITYSVGGRRAGTLVTATFFAGARIILMEVAA
jgi:hypothetical protein